MPFASISKQILHLHYGGNLYVGIWLANRGRIMYILQRLSSVISRLPAATQEIDRDRILCRLGDHEDILQSIV